MTDPEQAGEGPARASAHGRSWQTFEVVFGVPFVLALALQYFRPLDLPGGVLRLLFGLIGAGLITLGVGVVVLARRELGRRGQPTDPGHPTTSLVTSGVFSVSRNPLYLGGVCLVAGLGLAFDLPWVLILLVPALTAAHFVLIVPEERYLAARFGAPYLRYAASVDRWIGPPAGDR